MRRAGKKGQDQCLAEAPETPTDNSPQREFPPPSWGKIKKLANPNLSRIALLCGTNSLLEEQLGNGC